MVGTHVNLVIDYFTCLHKQNSVAGRLHLLFQSIGLKLKSEQPFIVTHMTPMQFIIGLIFKHSRIKGNQLLG